MARMFNKSAFQGDLSGWRLTKLRHAQYSKGLPRANALLDTADVFYNKMLGGPEHLFNYAARTPFSYVHAELPLENPGKCGWASPVMIRLAEEVGEVGRAIGMNQDELCAALVEVYTSRSSKNEPYTIPPLDFESLQ